MTIKIIISIPIPKKNIYIHIHMYIYIYTLYIYIYIYIYTYLVLSENQVPEKYTIDPNGASQTSTRSGNATPVTSGFHRTWANGMEISYIYIYI